MLRGQVFFCFFFLCSSSLFGQTIRGRVKDALRFANYLPEAERDLAERIQDAAPEIALACKK